ncbi:GtrA family protein [Planktomarina temperata]|nr:GtrA family protein [Planktomarina temperata]
MSKQLLIIRYTAFSIIATVVNLATQRALLSEEATISSFSMAVGAGTVVGLLLKYILDKKWIFYDFESGIKKNTRKFAIYMMMGLVTTAIFWLMELSFWLVWRTETARELGAIIGLSIGYIVKYNLDRTFVFNNRVNGVSKCY